MSFFSFTKSQNRQVEQGLSGVTGTSGKGKDVGKWCRRVNMLQILCAHACEWKNCTCLYYSGVGEERVKKNDGGGE
jgi:hypothetical protein